MEILVHMIKRGYIEVQGRMLRKENILAIKEKSDNDHGKHTLRQRAKCI